MDIGDIAEVTSCTFLYNGAEMNGVDQLNIAVRARNFRQSGHDILHRLTVILASVAGDENDLLLTVGQVVQFLGCKNVILAYRRFQCVNDCVSGDEQSLVDSFAQEVFTVAHCGAEIEIGNGGDELAVHLLGVGGILVICTQTGFYMTDLYLVVKRRKCAGKCCGCISVDENHVGFQLLDRLVHAGKALAGDCAECLLGGHDIEIPIRLEIKHLKNAVKHFAVLSCNAADGFDLLVFCKFFHQWSHFNGLRTSAEYAHNAKLVHLISLLVSVVDVVVVHVALFIMRIADNARHRISGDEHCYSKEDKFNIAAGDDHDRTQTQNTGDEIQRGNGLLLVHAHVNELMMCVAAVGGHRVLSSQNSSGEGRRGVVDRQTKNDKRNDKGDHSVEFEKSQHGDRCQHIAEESGTCVAHKDLGRVHIVGNKACAGTNKCGTYGCHRDIAHQQRDDQHRQRTNSAHSGGKTVQTIDQIDGVGDGNDPDDCNGDRPDTEIPVFTAKRKGVGNCRDQNTVTNGNQRGNNLQNQFHACTEGANIIHNANCNDDNRSDQDAAKLKRDLCKGQKCNNAAGKNCQTAEPGDRLLMHSAFIFRNVYRADLVCQPFDRRGEQKA